MKKLILFITSVMLVTFMSAGNKTTFKAAGDKCAYCCPKCKHCSDSAGECPKDKTAMVTSGTYCCKKDLTTSDVPAKCPKCNKDMHKVECTKNVGKKS